MDDLRELLGLTADLAADFYETLPERPVYPDVSADELRDRRSAGPLPDGPTDPRVVADATCGGCEPRARCDPRRPVLRLRDRRLGSRRRSRRTGSRRHGTRTPGCTSAARRRSSPRTSPRGWLKELLRIPAGASYAFVTGGQIANFTALASARHHVLERAGWDVERDGLTGAPRVRVVVGAKRHGTIDRALRMLGLGAPTDVVEADDNGRMLAEQLRADGRADDRVRAGGRGEHRRLRPVRRRSRTRATRAANAWLHVDGAFGLWAARARIAPAPRRRRRTGGLVGDRRPQVAERPVRQRRRVQRGTRTPSSARSRRRPRTSSTTRTRATRWTGRRSPRGARAGSPSTPRSSRSAAAASPSWSSAAARMRGDSPRGSKNSAPRC